MDVINYLMSVGLLAKSWSCPTCSLEMVLGQRKQLNDGFAWHCVKSKCGSRSYHSVREGSYFSKSKLPLDKYIRLFYLWSQDIQSKDVAETLGISGKSTMQHLQFLREVCTSELLQNQTQLGGQGVVVQIDESLFRHKAKYHRERGPTSEQCVFGLADTSTHPCTVYMQLVEDRKADTLIPIIERVVRKGSIIHSDQWAAYRQLHNHPDYTYQAVNHSENFVDPETGVHTQAIESYWSNAKLKFKKMKDVSSEQLPSYLDERMWRDRFGATTATAYQNIIKHISQQYPIYFTFFTFMMLYINV